jgi:hypothetical protein
VLAAVELWIRFPTELESDLSRFHGRSISEWLQGTMSSRLLLVFARHMDDDGAFRKAARKGSYTTEELVTATIANELMAMRYHQIGGDEPVFFRTNVEGSFGADEFPDFDPDELDEFLDGGFMEMFGPPPPEPDAEEVDEWQADYSEV